MISLNYFDNWISIIRFMFITYSNYGYRTFELWISLILNKMIHNCGCPLINMDITYPNNGFSFTPHWESFTPTFGLGTPVFKVL